MLLYIKSAKLRTILPTFSFYVLVATDGLGQCRGIKFPKSCIKLICTTTVKMRHAKCNFPHAQSELNPCYAFLRFMVLERGRSFRKRSRYG
jgi:hypothetical protein